MAGNLICVPPPVVVFLRRLREQCDRYGSVLFFDEVKTGLRLGLQGAQGLYGVAADLTTLGKVIGRGRWLLSAVGGQSSSRSHPPGPVYQAGPLAGNSVAMSAGLTTRPIAHRIVKDPVVQRLAPGEAQMATAAQIMIILLACNGAPLLLGRLLRAHRGTAIDLGWTMADGRPLFGASKTWRGSASMLLTGGLLSALFGHGWRFGLVMGLLAAVGDLLSSFVKRRLGLQSGARCKGLDQLPESALPGLYAVAMLDLPWLYALVLPMAFWGAQRLLSPALCGLGLRERPY